jgi:hypothetical protein
MPKKFIALFPVVLQLTGKSGRLVAFIPPDSVPAIIDPNKLKTAPCQDGLCRFFQLVAGPKKAFSGPELDSVFIKLSLLHFSEPVYSQPHGQKAGGGNFG